MNGELHYLSSFSCNWDTISSTHSLENKRLFWLMVFWRFNPQSAGSRSGQGWRNCSCPGDQEAEEGGRATESHQESPSDSQQSPSTGYHRFRAGQLQPSHAIALQEACFWTHKAWEGHSRSSRTTQGIQDISLRERKKWNQIRESSNSRLIVSVLLASKVWSKMENINL